MKKNITLTILTIIMFLSVSCNSGSQKTGNKVLPPQEKLQAYYTCPMHPEVQSNEPGKCPKCGMDLVKKEITLPDSTKKN